MSLQAWNMYLYCNFSEWESEMASFLLLFPEWSYHNIDNLSLYHFAQVNTILAFTKDLRGDKLGLNGFLGYVELFSATYYCRRSHHILCTIATNEHHYSILNHNPGESSCYGFNLKKSGQMWWHRVSQHHSIQSVVLSRYNVKRVVLVDCYVILYILRKRLDPASIVCLLFLLKLPYLIQN